MINCDLKYLEMSSLKLLVFGICGNNIIVGLMGLGSSGGETCQVKNKSNFSKTSLIRATILVSFMILFFSFLMCG